MTWRDLAHSLFQRQAAIGAQRQTATQWWDRPLSVWPVGVHDFPDKQRPLFGGRGNAGGTGFNAPAVLLGTATDQPADLAVQSISFMIDAPINQSGTNPYAYFRGFAHIWTPQNTPDPVAVAPPTFPALNRGFMRPRPRVSDSGRAVILSGQGAGAAIQPEAAAAPRWAQESNIAEISSIGANFPAPIHRTIYFEPALIVPAGQFIGVTGLNAASTAGGSIQLDVEFVWREVSP